MHRPLSLLKAVTCFTLASTVVARPGFDLTETEKELLERTASDMGSTCDLPQNTDANTQWSATKVTQFLDSILSQRGSGKMGSIQMLDKVVDKYASGQSTSQVDCTDFGNSCPAPSAAACKDTKQYSSPVWYWMQVAFHNFNDFNGQMYNQIAMAAIQEGLNIGDIANDVNMGWDTDPVTTSNYYNHVGAGLAIGGSIAGNVPGVGPLLSLAASSIGAYTSEKDKQNAIDLANAQANAAALKADAEKEMSNKVSSAMESAQSSLLSLMSWMFQTGSDWPSNVPTPNTDYDGEGMYLPTQIFSKGKFLNPISSQDIQNIRDQMVQNMRQSLLGIAFKANDVWATWEAKNDIPDCSLQDAGCNDACADGWLDTTQLCWTLTAYPPGNSSQLTNLMITHNKANDGPNPPGTPDYPGLFGKYLIDPWAFYANILDCATNPTGDGSVDMSQTNGPWDDSTGGLPKCFYNIGVTKATKAGSPNGGHMLPPDGSAQNPNPGVPLNQLIMVGPSPNS